jgi:DNA (cytosine-5)-methyltransferase 1
MTHFDLFSGYGGFSLALQKVYGDNNLRPNELAGSERPKELHNTENELQQRECVDNFETIGFSEIDKYASAVLKYHWPNTKNYGDITNINWSEVPDFDLLTGGSPCQDLSIAGKRRGLEGERSGLFYEYMRAVREKKPKYFIWENVKGALSSNQGFDFATVINEMAEAGYSLWWQVLNAKDFGVPQNRERIFIIGFRDGSPREVFFEAGDNGETLKQIIGGSQGNRVYEESGVSVNLSSNGGGQGHKTGLYAITRGRSTEPWKAGTVAPSRRLSDKDDIKVVDTPRIRRLTPTECERLMGLPDGWTSKGIIDDKEVEISDSQRYKLCGNGVVVNVVEEIIKQLINQP